jgi:chromosome segregation ATPase
MLKSHLETREELKASREAVSEAEEVLNSLQREISENQNISRYLILRTDLKRIQNNNRGSQEDLELFAKPISEQKLIIAQNITEANSRSTILESKVKEMVSNLASLKANRAEIISSRRETSDKYKIIQAKSEEIDALLRKLSIERENLERNIAEFHSNIERVAERIHVNKKTEAANAERVLFESDLDASKYTSSQLEIELRKRRKELEELDTAEATCVNEISNLRAEIAALQAKLADLLDVEKTRESKTNELHDLEKSCERSEEQVASLSKQLDEEKTLLASKNTLLRQNGVHAKLAIVDEKLNLVNREISELKQKMDSHLFTSEKRNLSEMIEKVQQLLMKQQREFM